MTVQDALQSSAISRTDAELLLADAANKPRTWIIAHADDELDPSIIHTFTSNVERRKAGEPVAYILERAAFYGRTFHVTPDVLIPRPATEGLIDQALRMMRNETVERVTPIDTDIVAWCERIKDNMPIAIVDVGTGSGCIAITLALELPAIRIIATDISNDALTIARKNAEVHGVIDRIEFRLGDGIEPVMDIDQPFLLVSNPPYIPTATTLMHDVEEFEPHSALFSGDNGTDVLDQLISDAKTHPHCIGWTIECMGEQVR